MTTTSGCRQRTLDRVFLLGIAVKGLDGIVELIVGLPLLFLHPAQVDALAQSITAEELTEDPHDAIAHLILNGTGNLDARLSFVTAVYLVIHGLVKVTIILAMIRGSARVYPWALAALAAFLVWQAVELILHPSIGVAVLTLLDALIIALTWREWRAGRSLHDALRCAFPPR
jgi:uncharacterized membrane protein